MSTYLDYNASAPIDQRVLDVMIEVYKEQLEMQIVELIITVNQQD